MKSLAIVVSGGSTNNLVQVLTLVMAAVHSEMKARVLFRDESIFRLTPETINRQDLSPIHAADAAGTAERLAKLDLTDLHKLCRDIKESGDVKFYVCSSSLAISGIDKEDLITEIDEVMGLPTFLLEDLARADIVLTF